jgi:hypothetical protein
MFVDAIDDGLMVQQQTDHHRVPVHDCYMQWAVPTSVLDRQVRAILCLAFKQLLALLKIVLLAGCQHLLVDLTFCCPLPLPIEIIMARSTLLDRLSVVLAYCAVHLTDVHDLPYSMMVN